MAHALESNQLTSDMVYADLGEGDLITLGSLVPAQVRRLISQSADQYVAREVQGYGRYTHLLTCSRTNWDWELPTYVLAVLVNVP